ncbi:helix-turn-helix domain-containing protein [Neomesorhizobium albiziae]|uniref:helix-turn-helix domain-containing protein n=1 Tax=Neomesorhizobium albiziae TaxID=335020 RepID=UPI003CC7ED4C
MKQLSARWQVSERQVHRFIQGGALSAHKLGRLLRISEDDVPLFELRSPADRSCQLLTRGPRPFSCRGETPETHAVCCGNIGRWSRTGFEPATENDCCRR